MPKKQTTKKRKSESDVNLRSAIAAGKSVGDEVVAFRAKQRKKREALEGKLKKRPARAAAPQLALRIPGLSRPRPTAGVLIAEGDSWFDYPLQDVLRLLEDDHLFDVESVAHKGDCVEDMAHSPGQFEEFARRLEKLLRDGKVPKAILLSGGGNDIAGDEFAILLNHAASSLPPINEDIVRGVIDIRLKEAYASIISALTTIAKSFLNKPIPIVTHGYDYPIPDGRGVLGGFGILPGPWLKPGFQKKGYEDLNKNKLVMQELIDRFNKMLSEVSALPEFAHVHYIDLRKTLKHDGTYKTHWANELHPTKTGFELVTNKFAAAINSL